MRLISFLYSKFLRKYTSYSIWVNHSSHALPPPPSLSPHLSCPQVAKAGRISWRNEGYRLQASDGPLGHHPSLPPSDAGVPSSATGARAREVHAGDPTALHGSPREKLEGKPNSLVCSCLVKSPLPLLLNPPPPPFLYLPFFFFSPSR